ncbi:hypothetical protein ACTIVE_4853 [Actinomadura verrucosospora]|uniref:Uncharacterized protein n=1 Tax=Actinomadura verrucosospora TaxID=46165 RepID=A0A7D3W0A8_ACTVE|nr:hypothetical protein ACTIVE_4853 [Actinomadura verrucosospora]
MPVEVRVLGAFLLVSQVLFWIAALTLE